MALLGLELNGDLDHINRLDDTGGKHTADSTDNERLNGVKELVHGRFGRLG
jgi:hypothetical protein